MFLGYGLRGVCWVIVRALSDLTWLPLLDGGVLLLYYYYNNIIIILLLSLLYLHKGVFINETRNIKFKHQI